MCSIGIIIHIYTDKEIVKYLHKCDDILEGKKFIIEKIGDTLNKENLDFPVTFDEFISMWMEIYGIRDVYTYDIFMDNEWVTLWTDDEIYDDIYDYMLIKQSTILNNDSTCDEYDISSDKGSNNGIEVDDEIDNNMEILT